MKKLDRLASLISHFEIQTAITENADSANLVILGSQDQADELILLTTPASVEYSSQNVLAAIHIDFGGQANPVLDALPKSISMKLGEAPEINALAELIAAEANYPRCGKQVALDRLCEILIIKVLRIQIAEKSIETGVFAALAHPNLCPTVVAIHDNPERNWKLDEFVHMSGMSRTGFIGTFSDIVGSTPMAYLKTWRLTLARNAIRNGKRVKETASRYGYGSGDAFTRAFTNAFGVPPTSLSNLTNPQDIQPS